MGFQSFYDKWDKEFQIQKKNHPGGISLHRFWQGTTAFKSLLNAGAIWNVMPVPPFNYGPIDRLLRSLFREVQIYRQFRNAVSDINNEFKDCIDVTTQVLAKMRKMPGSLSPIESSRDRSIKALTRELERLKRHRDIYWDRALLASAEERAKWPILPTGDPTDPVEYLVPEELMIWEKNLTVTLKMGKPIKNIDLDTRFQLRIARALQFYLNVGVLTGLPLRIPRITISSLVVLTYIAAQLAQEENNKLYIPGENLHTKRALTVEAVYQKL